MGVRVGLEEVIFAQGMDRWAWDMHNLHTPGSKDGHRNVVSRAWVMEEAAEKAGNV